jgi:hypothetical protein
MFDSLSHQINHFCNYEKAHGEGQTGKTARFPLNMPLSTRAAIPTYPKQDAYYLGN